jgi:hypothetical protein
MRLCHSGFLLLGAAIPWPANFPTSAALHTWTADAFGLMTLAVMTRASLGHTGRDLVASIPTQLIAVLVAALARIAAAFAPSVLLLHLAGFAWAAAFAGLAAAYGRRVQHRLLHVRGHYAGGRHHCHGARKSRARCFSRTLRKEHCVAWGHRAVLSSAP